MKKVYILAFVLFVFCINPSSQVVYNVYTYNGPGNGLDQSMAVCTDQRDNFYITGTSLGTSSDMDICTIKYPSTSASHPTWLTRFNGSANYAAQGNAVAVDNNFNVYVTGWAHMSSEELLCGTITYVTIKYNSYGVQQWMQEYNGGSSGSALALALDAQANVYITGSSVGSNAEDIVTIKYNTNGAQQWVARYNGPSNGSDVGRSIAVDLSGNVYVCGNSYQTGGGSDYITIKYNSSGVQQWAARYNGPGNGNDTAFGLVITYMGNIVVTGCAKGTTSNLDYTTISYGPDGSLQWVKTYNGPGNGIDEAKAIVTDIHSNVYVTGYSQGSGNNYDFATVSYDVNGGLIWVQRYEGPASLDDKACGIAFSYKPCGESLDNVCLVSSIFVAGQSKNASGRYDYVTIKYDIAGDSLWVSRYSPPNGDAIPSAIIADNFCDMVVVTGTINNDYGTIVYNPRTDLTENVSKTKQQLSQNYPNPFNPSTKIKYYVTAEASVSLKIYDILGKEVAVLVNGRLAAGDYETNWNADKFPSGIYFYTLESNGVKLETKRMLLIK